MLKQRNISAHIGIKPKDQLVSKWLKRKNNHLFPLNFSIKAAACVVSMCVVFNTAAARR